MIPWRQARAVLLDPACAGVGAISLVARDPFWDEADLPFRIAGGGTVLRVIPQRGFPRESLAATPDERLLMVECPDDEGWLVPDAVVANWMTHHVTCPPLDDIVLSHPLYEYLTHPDEDGLSRGGAAPLVQWVPGLPTLATLAPPEFLPDDDEAPEVNRERRAYADAVADLVGQLGRRFALVETELALRFSAHRS